MHGVLTISPSGVSLTCGSNGSMNISMFLVKWLPIYKSIIIFSLFTLPILCPLRWQNVLYVAGIAKSTWPLAKGWRIRGSNRGGGRDFSDPSGRPRGPHCLLYNEYRVFLLGVKRPRCGVDHPPPSSAELEYGYSYTSLPPLSACLASLYCNKLKPIACSKIWNHFSRYCINSMTENIYEPMSLLVKKQNRA
jgi:hypothetical protein